jgi:DNA-binding PadR family transcriptional regulator
MHHHSWHHDHHHRGDHGDAVFAGRARGFAGPGRGFGESRHGGRGGRGGFPFGRFVGDGELRLIVLSLIAESPRHGYEIIKALEERSSGFYSPSPGVIYPTLTYLEESGQATASTEGNKKVYAITDAGRATLEENRVQAEAILSRLASIGERLAKAKRFFDRDEAPDRDIPDVVPELNAARRAVKAALAAKHGASPEEQRRIAEVLVKAAQAIAARSEPSPDDIDI